MGGIMLLLWVIRFFIFDLYESPKFLMGRGRDEDAVAVVHKIADYNKTTSSLTVEMLHSQGELTGADTSAAGAVSRTLSKFNTQHVRALFATRKLAYSTFLLIVLWGKLILRSMHYARLTLLL
jgi:hypothetical protein